MQYGEVVPQVVDLDEVGHRSPPGREPASQGQQVRDSHRAERQRRQGDVEQADALEAQLQDEPGDEQVRAGADQC